MLYQLYYTIDPEEYVDYVSDWQLDNIDLSKYDTVSFTYDVREELEDVIDYLFIQKYDRPYKSNLGWYLEDGAKEFVKNIEDKYWHNTLDTFTIYHDPKFIEYLTENYREDAVRESLNYFLKEIEEDN